MNACKVTTTKEKDFDENMLVVQIQIQKYGMRNVLLDGGFGMNIASKDFGRSWVWGNLN